MWRSSRHTQNEGIDWQARDLRYLLHDEYDARFRTWLDEAAVHPSVDAARAAVSRGGSGDVKVLYRDQRHLVAMFKELQLMEDLKAGVPRTGYHGVVLVRIHGRRVFLAPAYKVDQDITKRLGR